MLAGRNFSKIFHKLLKYIECLDHIFVQYIELPLFNACDP